MPDRHHQSRTQDRPSRDGRDRSREREYRRDDQRYREERSAGYPRDEHSRTQINSKPPAYEDAYHHEPQEMYSDSSTYESTHQPSLYNLRYLTTSRGICQILEVALNLLIIICAGVPYSNKGRYRDIASLGGLYYYYYGGAQAFTAQEAVQVNELDDLFYQMKLPSYTYSMAFGGALMAYALGVLALGLFRVPFRWPAVLPVEAVLDALIGLGYLPAVAFFFIKLQEAYSSSVCKQREAMYQSKALKVGDCGVSGTDVAGGIFGVLCFILFLISAVLAVQAFRTVRRLKQQREAEDNNL
ncbi:MARVEL domain-containing protein 3 [Astyanax mexicanus]|uniref:MARVEL domain-containing protein 3 n=2 Tax=Astyanax mexicanus TaxID=7994 RepID=A0A8B9HUG9_ASTMX|nr:MARVEL domain-containing protein 3 [Astyanax mexicanus]